MVWISASLENQHFIALPNYCLAAPNLLVEKLIHSRDLVWFNKSVGSVFSCFVAEDLETQPNHIVEFLNLIVVTHIINCSKQSTVLTQSQNFEPYVVLNIWNLL